jgi:uncharacterized membrane protein
MPEPTTTQHRFLPQRLRLAVLTAHIMISVGLLGDSAGFLAVAIRAARTQDPAAVIEQVRVLNMFSMVFGIPLSIGAIVTGVILGLGTRWGIFRYPWVTLKVLLILSVMLVGGVFIGPAQAVVLERGGNAVDRLIAAASYDVIALAVATGLSVFKPGGRFRRAEAVFTESD